MNFYNASLKDGEGPRYIEVNGYSGFLFSFWLFELAGCMYVYEKCLLGGARIPMPEI